ncbi:DExH-box ATP-dependent RNA helicase DExH15 chloroplastic isoform X2 [Rosa chinensis]|uniref:DExH-box ATP-dependent RNA helicase DExH15 chloroplastic isoform X2 n=1 Tax=Rosa chinensis TaxID=74649 RepID=UPI000D093C1E|nr:DExH-box ATP-dependent RNA helicase DExH15 chloroplastic isoform X2 [Rosa chinensis]
MDTFSILSSPSHTFFTRLLSLKPSPPHPLLHHLTQTLAFSSPKFPHTQNLLRFRVTVQSPSSAFPAKSQLSDADDDEEEDEFEEDDDEDVAADEYDDISGDMSDGLEQSDDEIEMEDSMAGAEPPAIRDEEFRWKRVEKLCEDVKLFGEEMIDDGALASIYDFRIDKFQRLAIQAFLRGSSVVVSAPTSSGKTLIAEAAAVATVAKGRRLFYTTPLKALSNQKFREFRVGMSSARDSLFHVDVIVLDEVHYLSDISRGTVWEEIVIYSPKVVQLICLSATVANPDELAGWIGQIHGKTELVTSTKRPVPLTWHFSTKTSLLPLLDKTGKHMNRRLSVNYLQLSAAATKSNKDDGSRRRSSRRRASETSYDDSTGNMSRRPLSKNDINLIYRSQVPQVTDTLWHLKARDMLPAVWFIFSRKGCDAAVQYIQDCKLLDDCEASEVELALKRFRIKYPDAIRESAVKGLLRGVAAHHAGCLPLWKSFIEELFQRGLVKVVFATETLAAGINMPARTAIIASLSKRSDSGRTLLSSNELLQMAGRAGRRGTDERGHVVLIQNPYEGAEAGCKVLFAGLEPLVSQFTASYGMVLNLLAGSKVTRRSSESDDTKASQPGRTLDEARKLVEQSFGNYVGSNVMVAAKEELARIEKEIEMLTLEISDDAIDRKSRKLLSGPAYKEIADLQEELRAEKRLRTELRKRMESQKLSSLRPLLKECENGHLPFLCLQYKDSEGVQHSIPTVYLGKVELLSCSKLKNMVSVDDSFALNAVAAESEPTSVFEPSYYAALGSDNSWYLFTEKWIKTIYKTGFPNVALAQGDALPREIMSTLLDKTEMKWEKLAESDLGGFWGMEGSLETWSWSLNVPVLNSLSEHDELLLKSEAYNHAIGCYKEQRSKVSRLKKKISRTQGFREYKKIIDMANYTEEKIKRLKGRSRRLTNRIEQIEPSGWKEFLQISNVIHETRALDINTHTIFPLGETAASIRGENELWLAMVLRNKILLSLKPTELAAVCASLVSEGIKIRPWKNNSYIYEPSSTVIDVVSFLDEQRSTFLQLQEKHGVNKPCYLDTQFAGMVEAWVSGLTWREIMMDCAMDEGDLARLLRRTIDLLVQIPKLPDIDPVLQSNAKTASNIMDRPPISELAG